MTATIFTKNKEVDNNAHDESCEVSCEKRVSVINLGPEKRVYIDFFHREMRV